MARIQTYIKDSKITSSDFWIGSDGDNYNQTKNFTPAKLSEYFNANQVIDIGTQIQYKYYTLENGEDRPRGTLTFENEIGAYVNFSGITTFLLSNTTTKGNVISEYLNFLNKARVVISRSNNINQFGYFDIVNIESYIPDPNFYKITVQYLNGNGRLEEDLDYIITLIQLDVIDGNVESLDFSSTTGDLTLGRTGSTPDLVANLDGRYLTGHPIIEAAASVDNSGRTYIQDITLDAFGHILSITSGTETTEGKSYTLTVGEGTSNSAVLLLSGSDLSTNIVEIVGDANQIKVTEASGQINIGLPDNVNIVNNLTIGGTFSKVGGTSGQILMADGSVITAGSNITISGGVISSATDNSNIVHLDGNETITGLKTFTNGIILQNPESILNGANVIVLDPVTNKLKSQSVSSLLGAGVGTLLLKNEFNYTSSQSFTCSENIGSIYSVSVNGQELSGTQYSFATNVLSITDTLESGDYIIILYSGFTQIGVSNSYSRLEVDKLMARDWMSLARGYSSIPTKLEDLSGGGSIWRYKYNADAITLYRRIQNGGLDDTFNTTYSTGTVSGLIAKKQINYI